MAESKSTLMAPPPPLSDRAGTMEARQYPRVVAKAPAVARSAAKRLLDLVLAMVLSVILLPPALLIAAAIRLTSPGPALFRQDRIGRGGRPFTMLKFRSMYTGCPDEPHREYVTGLVNGEREAAQEGAYKLADDERVTAVGRWLRRTSLDELPQLINVLRGEMSLVGPRPPLPYEVEQYDSVQMRRLSAPPGITGLWQVSGRNQLSYRSMIQLDLEYIDRWSLLLDLGILARTVPVVLKNSGRAR